MPERLTHEEMEQRIKDLEAELAEREQLENVLRESEDRFRLLYERAPVGYQSLDENGNFLEVNQAWLDTLGYSREEVLGKSFGEFLHPDWRDHFKENFPRFKAVGEILGVEFEMMKKDGTVIFVSFNGKIGRDHAGKFKQTHCVLTDITERKMYEYDLKNANRKLEGVLDGISDIIGIQKPDYTVVRYNKAGYDTLGLRHEDVAGKTCYSLIGRTEPCDPCATTLALESRKPESVEWYVPELDRYYLCRSNPVLDDNGNVQFIIEHLHDMTKRKLAEDELRRANTFLDSIIENIPTMVFLKDAGDLRYVRLNRAGEQLLGYSRAELSGKSDYDFFPAEQADFFRNKDREVLAGKDIMDIPEEEVDTREKGVRILHTRKVPLLNDKGDAEYLLGISEDITEKRLAEEERKRLERQLIQSQKMEAVGRLAGGVAHDFNNMLGVILGHTEMAMSGITLEDPLYSDLAEIAKAARRSADLTRQLLGFARRQTIAPKVIHLNETVEKMLRMLRRLIGEDIDLAWMPGKKLWPVNMDPSQLDQILANLCVNARDAIEGVGKVTIETGNVTLDENYCEDRPGFHPGDYVMLAVSDDGIGMERDVLDSIFDPFFTTKEVGKGTGLGLSTVYGIVKQNGGYINVYSEPGEGTTFKLYIPRHMEMPGRPGEKAEDAPPVGGDETVLLVEDEPMLLQMGKAMLERFGYRVFSAGSPAEAVKLACELEGRIDLLITDVVMPAMNGKELAAELQVLCPGIKTLFMSGYTANAIAHHGVLDAGVHFIQKPFSLKDLSVKVRQVLKGDRVK